MSEHNNTPENPNIQPRHVFSALPKYAAGKPPTPVEGLKQYKLSSNENPRGPIPEVRRILSEFEATHLYPDPLSTKLRTALARRLGVDAKNIVTGAGSLGALNQILKAFAGASLDGTQDEVIYAWRSFEAYPILVGLLGAKSVQVPNLPNGAHDLNAMARAVTDRTRIILICTPNNPTGPAVTEVQVREFLATIPANVVVVLDEAYYEFCTASTVPAGQDAPVNGLDLLDDYPNVIVLRTFSKAQGLAGLRVGYSISHPKLTQYLRVAATPFAVTALAEAAAVASIEHEESVMEGVRHIVAERERVSARLRELGYWFPETYANFVWLPLGEHTGAFAELAAANALSVRAFDGEGVRVSIGEDEANDRFISICEQFPHRV
ncbi:MAG: histidinol-phosphate transaminase [Rothia sp. (in: high G+C Gram-positive bacteria)]|uniref:histidinol-phosphate transaminase n=1 Tax=Rothia sp. (in: high G+C Gram-positive bacteria) TaxID=1885016 RepID=UPI0026DBD4C2|nr:histidinol-phosphate transaminase [Rothia sp. (in: high G+C Gram-positive bacteria)]MDO4884543.1 histidinol-phosphate transaminase [Rothia sp. (in: high G+C Gram-positive bacteria)]